MAEEELMEALAAESGTATEGTVVGEPVVVQATKE